MSPSLPASTSPTETRHVVVTVHGIRTFGQWQERLGHLLAEAEPGIEVFHYKYGYFSIIAFLIPFLRWMVTRRFRREIEKIRQRHPDARLDLVGHSFGTHLIGHGVRGWVRAGGQPRIDTIILAGSVLKVNFPWRDLMDDGHVRRLVNECGTKDGILVINQLGVLFTGMAGRVGFNGLTDERFANRFYCFGHSGYFQKAGAFYDDFLRDRWVPLLTTPSRIEPHDERPAGGFIQGFTTFALNNTEPIKVAVYAAPFVALSLLFYGLYDDAKHQLYLASMNLASQAYRDGDVSRVRELVASQKPGWQRRDDRGFEWALFRRYADGNTHTLRGTGKDRLDFPYGAWFAADGDTFVTLDPNGHAHLWDTATVRERNSLAGATGPYTDVQVFTDGRLIGVSESGGSVTLRDLQTGKSLGSYGDAAGPALMHREIATDGAALATIDIENTLRVWDIPSAQLRFTRPGMQGGSAFLHFGLGGKALVWFDLLSHEIRLWDATIGDERLSVPDPATVTSTAISPDGNTLALGYKGGELRLWDLAAGRERVMLGTLPQYVASLAFSSDGTLLAVGGSANDGGAGGRIWLYEVTPGRERGRVELAGRTGGMSSSLVFSPDGRTLAMPRQLLGAEAVPIILWDTETGRERAALAGHTGFAQVTFSPDSKTLATVGGDGTIRLWDPVTAGEQLALWDGWTPTTVRQSAAFTPDGRRFATSARGRDADEVAQLWDARRGRITQTLRGVPNTGAWHVAFSPDGRTLATSYPALESVGLWDVGRDTQRAVLKPAYIDRGQPLTFSPDGTMLATGVGWNGGVTLWDVATGRPRRQIDVRFGKPGDGVPGSPTALAFAPDGRTLALGGWDGRIRLVGVADGRERLVLTSPAATPGTSFMMIPALAFSPDGRLLAAGQEGDGRAHVWDVSRGRLRALLGGHGTSATSVAFSPDGRTLATAGAAASVRLWDVATFQERAILPTDSAVTSLAFAPDGLSLLATTGTGAVLLWRGSGDEAAPIIITMPSAPKAGP